MKPSVNRAHRGKHLFSRLCLTLTLLLGAVVTAKAEGEYLITLTKNNDHSITARIPVSTALSQENNYRYTCFWKSDSRIELTSKGGDGSVTICKVSDIYGFPTFESAATLYNNTSITEGKCNSIVQEWIDNVDDYSEFSGTGTNISYKLELAKEKEHIYGGSSTDYFLYLYLTLDFHSTIPVGDISIFIHGTFCYAANPNTDEETYFYTKSGVNLTSDYSFDNDSWGSISRANKSLNWSVNASGTGTGEDYHLQLRTPDAPKIVSYYSLSNIDADISRYDILKVSGSQKSGTYTQYGINRKSLVFRPVVGVSPHDADGKLMRFREYNTSVSLPGYPYPQITSAEVTNQVTKEITVKWDAKRDDEDVSTDGQWYVFRESEADSTSRELIAKLDYGVTEYADTERDAAKKSYGNSYIYSVVFVPDGWTVTRNADADGLFDTQIVELKHSLYFSNVTVDDERSSLHIKWNHSKIVGASVTTPVTINLERSIDEKTWTKIYEATIEDSNTTEGEFYDSDGITAYQPYAYRLNSVFEEDRLYSDIVYGTLNSGFDILSFNASRGQYTGTVKLTWEIEKVGSTEFHIRVERRPLGSASQWATIYNTSGSSTSFSYDDQTAAPGSYYEYRLMVWAELNGETRGQKQAVIDGFCMSSGIVSGRVYYDTGTSVPDVKVTLTPNQDDGGTSNLFHSIAIESANNSGIVYDASLDDAQALLNQDFTAQFYLRPTAVTATQNIYKFGNLALKLTPGSDTAANLVVETTTNQAASTHAAGTVALSAWNHISLAYNDGNRKLHVFIINETGEIDNSLNLDVHIDEVAEATPLQLCHTGSETGGTGFSGNIDEFRFYTKELTQADILKDFSHTLSGIEDGLAIYWPMDEGIANTKVVYDYSKTNNVNNDRVGRLNVAATSSTVVPDENLLSLCGYTDSNGNYTVRGIHFSGEGTNYSITPTMGIHKFNPSSATRFVSINSLVHSGVDFKDESSFPVSGQVFYEGTTIPVADAYIKIDGTAAAKDGKAVTTAADGTFTVSVPIGDHFISLDLSGHQFTDGGRYPADPDSIGARHTFESALTGLTFYDTTKVTVAGRVAGGSAEEKKPLGLNAGVANIGSATLTLDFDGSGSHFINAVATRNGTSVSYDRSATRRDYEASQGQAYVAGGGNALTIVTDSVTGEFVAKVPPLKFTARSIVIPSQTDIDFSRQLPTIDLTDVTTTHTDSIADGNGLYRYFVYNGSAKVIHNATPTITVTQKGSKAFGMESVDVTDLSGNTENVKLYTVADDGSVDYTFGYPVFKEVATYHFNIRGFERYTNKDGGEGNYAVYDSPLQGALVSIKNDMGSEAVTALEDNKILSTAEYAVTLDSIGCGTYSFIAGLPNVQAPYTRNLNISFNYNDVDYAWSENGKFGGIILGYIAKGNNFVTNGPDKLFTIIRDPGGSYSKTTYSTGSRTIQEHYTVSPVESTNDFTVTQSLGLKIVNNIGVGFSTQTEIIAIGQTSQEFIHTKVNENGDGTITTYTTTQDISTSDSPEYVGANGDVFVGSSTNMNYGDATNVEIAKDEVSGQYEIRTRDIISCGQEYSTTFNYTSSYIENELMPNFIKMRDNLLVHVDDVNSVARPVGDTPIYVTTWLPGDPVYGSSNTDEGIWGDQALKSLVETNGRCVGPSYTIVLPVTDKDFCLSDDKVLYYNEQYKLWTKYLAQNEQSKVEAISGNKTHKNYSFDGGSEINISCANTTDTYKTDNTTDITQLILNINTRATLNECGLIFNYKRNDTYTDTTTDRTDTETTSGYSFTLKDNERDNMSIDVYENVDTYGPIFYTRAGQTSNPFEDEVTTKYYKPGTVISERTQQIEKPEIEILDPIVTGVPSGKTASFRVALRNNSEAGRDCYYGLVVSPDTNPNGAQLRIDGQAFTGGIELYIPYGETVYKTITLAQTNVDVLEYRDIELTFYSINQPDDSHNFPGIYSKGTVSVYFQPTCSDISLLASTKVINTESTAPLMLNIRGYDYSMSSLKGVRLQYKGINDADFVTLQEYVKDESRLQSDPNLLPLPALTASSALSYAIDLRESAFTDQTYLFRAITVCDSGNGEINNESEEVAVARDMTRPQLIATPSPSSGVLYPGDDISITFAEDIRNGSISGPECFTVTADVNESTVAHEVALSLSGEEQARSEATMNLSDKSFSVNLWLNYTADGQIFQHGANDSGFSINVVDGKPVVAVGATTLSSEVVLPKDKWIFLNVSYDNSGSAPLINAAYATDASTVTIFTNAQAPKYLGNGPVALGGEGLNAKISELAIWNSSRTMAEAQGDMYTSKSVYTPGLTGYWRFNEGHGSVAADLAQSRTISLPGANAWWISGTNYSLAFDGDTAANADVTAISTSPTESYMIEGWLRAEKAQDGAATFWSLGNSLLEMRLNESGALELVTNGAATQVSDADMRDGRWHHVALNVLHSTNGSATIYVDGAAKRQLAASTVPSLQAEMLTLGAHRTSLAVTDVNTNTFKYDRFLKGNVDEIRVWKGRMTADVIEANRYNRLDTAAVDGLLAYFPFETSQLDGFNQAVNTGCLNDFTGKTSGISMVAGEDGATAAYPTYDASNSPALKPAPSLENVGFNFVASERSVTLTLTEDPYKIEGCDVYITAKNIRDLAGNACDPIKWSVYVQQNVLRWSDSSVQVTRSVIGEKSVFNMGIENLASTSEHWQIEELPSWLTVNVSSGTLAPISSGQVKFTVDNALAVGRYEATVYLRSSLNIATPLHISVIVEGEVPDWMAIPDEYSMSVVGKLQIDGDISSDPNDLIAAFDGNTCVGVASPRYYSRYDAYIVPMTIYGSSTARKTLRYKIYDASTGMIYPMVAASDQRAMTFAADTWVGSFNGPVIFSPENKIEQTISQSRAGWQWVSLYLEPDVATVADLFTNEGAEISTIKNAGSTALYESGAWGGSLVRLSTGSMYKIKGESSYAYDLVGAPCDPSAVAQTLGTGWSWIGYPCASANGLNEAFADAGPQDGDLVKNQTDFAIFTDNEWIGSLTAMTPGDGYNYYSNAPAAKTFHFASVTSSQSYAPAKAQADGAVTFNSLCENTATMIARVMDGDAAVSDAAVSVLSHGELRGYSETEVGEALHFISVGLDSATGDDDYVFSVKVGGYEYLLPLSARLTPNQHIGKIGEPYILQINGSTLIDGITAGNDIARVMLYDTTGVMVMKRDNPAAPFSARDLTSLPQGVYVQCVLYNDGAAKVEKLINR